MESSVYADDGRPCIPRKDALAENERMTRVKIPKAMRLERAALKEFRRGVKRGYKLTPDDLPQWDYRYYAQHDIASHPRKEPNGWRVSFWIQHPDDSDYELCGPFMTSDPEDLKPTIGEAHHVGFAIARALLRGQPEENLMDVTESERQEIRRFRGELEARRKLFRKWKEEAQANLITKSTKCIRRLELSAKQLQTLLDIAFSTFPAFGDELDWTCRSLRELSLAVTEQTGSTDSNERLQDWVARVPSLVDSLQNLVCMGTKYHQSGWPFGDPFITRPGQIVDDIRRRYRGTPIRVRAESPQFLDLVYPKSTLFTIFHGLITNAIRHSGDSPRVQMAWHVCAEKFICEIEDNGPGLCESLSSTYLQLYKLGDAPIGKGGLVKMEVSLMASHTSLLFRRSAELGGTQVKLELPLVGYWLNDQLHLWEQVYETPFVLSARDA